MLYYDYAGLAGKHLKVRQSEQQNFRQLTFLLLGCGLIIRRITLKTFLLTEGVLVPYRLFKFQTFIRSSSEVLERISAMETLSSLIAPEVT